MDYPKSNINTLMDSKKSKYITPNGLHIIADLAECTKNIELMYISDELEQTLFQMVVDAILNPIQSSFYQFPKSGVTGIILLAESHISIHTWPEIHYISLDIFVCNMSQDNKSKAKNLYNNCLNLFKPKNIKESFIDR